MISLYLCIYVLCTYRRQFDNVKRIFRAVEELPGTLTNNIKQHFFISNELAKYVSVRFVQTCMILNNTLITFRKYACIVFLACLRFETSKKKLQYLSFSDLLTCSHSIMIYWTYTYQVGS